MGDQVCEIEEIEDAMEEQRKVPTVVAQNGFHKKDEKEQSSPRTRRKNGSGSGSGGLPLYVFLQDGSNGGEKKTVDPRCPNKSNPYHVCTNYCIPKLNNEINAPKSPLSFLSRPNSFSSSSSGRSSKTVGDNQKADPRCKNASNPYHECTYQCFNKLPALDLPVQNSPKGDGKNKKVDPKCPNASNPFHECTDICLSKLKLNDANKEEGLKSPFSFLSRHSSSTSSTGSSGKMGETKKVDPKCNNASNPYHECTDICFQKMQVSNNHGTSDSSIRRKSKGTVKNVEKRQQDVHPSCVNASNPYHKCTNYCFDKIER